MLKWVFLIVGVLIMFLGYPISMIAWRAQWALASILGGLIIACIGVGMFAGG